ncbi:hypothetical protein JOJ88_005323 [Pantoea cypripedii]|nr:hypothetical protein [Pantoea cypripedii]
MKWSLSGNDITRSYRLERQSLVRINSHLTPVGAAFMPTRPIIARSRSGAIYRAQ